LFRGKAFWERGDCLWVNYYYTHLIVMVSTAEPTTLGLEKPIFLSFKLFDKVFEIPPQG